MKNLKKVLALVLAFAMVLSTFTTVFAAEEAQNLEKAEALHELGLFDGKSSTSFDPALLDGATREEAIKLLAEAFGWDLDEDAVSPFEDVSPYAEQYVAYAFENGVTKGKSETHFGAKDPITDRQLVTLITRELGFGDAWADITEAVDAGLIDFSEALAITSGAKEINRDYAVGLIYATLTLEYKDGGTVIAALVEAGKVDAELAEELGLYEVPAPAALEVVSAVPAGLKAIDIEFSKDVDEDTLGDIVVKDKAVASRTLFDEKTVRVVLTADVEQSTKLTVVIEKVKSTDGQVIAKVEKEVLVEDKIVPTAVSAVAENLKQIIVTFSEPVKLAYNDSAYRTYSNVKLDGNSVVANLVANPADNTLTINFPSIRSVGAQTLSLTDFVDYAGFKIVPTEFEVVFVEDNDAPVLESAKVISKTIIDLTFNEKVEVLGDFTVNNRAVASIQSQSDKVVRVTLGTALDLGAVVEVKVDYKGQKDVAGNEVKEWTTFRFNVADDTSFPTVEAKLESTNEVVLTFSKSMTSTVGKITLQDKDKKDVRTVLSTVGTWSEDYTVLKLSASTVFAATDLNVGTYYLVLAEFKDATVRENPLPTTTVEIKTNDTKAPVLASAEAIITNGSETKYDTVTIFFNEAMNADTLKNLSNYYVDGKPISTVAGVSIKEVAGDSKSVTITYPNAREATVLAEKVITIYAVQDIAGNPIAPGATVTAKLKDTLAQALAVTGIAATEKRKVEITFNKPISQADPSIIRVSVGSTTLSPIAFAIDGSKVVLTLGSDLPTDIAAVEIVPYNYELIRDLFGVQLASTASITSATLKDEIAPEVVSVVASPTEIRVEFSEKISEGIALEYLLVVKDVTGKSTLLNGVDYVVTTDDTDLVITGTFDLGKTYSVALLDGRGITDAASPANNTAAFDAKEVVVK